MVTAVARRRRRAALPATDGSVKRMFAAVGRELYAPGPRRRKPRGQACGVALVICLEVRAAGECWPEGFGWFKSRVPPLAKELMVALVARYSEALQG